MSTDVPIKWSRQSDPPSWYKKGKRGYYEVTSGTSPNNEWYYFPSQDKALILFAAHRGITDYVIACDGQAYHVDDVTESEFGFRWVFTPNAGAKPAEVQDLLFAMSNF